MGDLEERIGRLERTVVHLTELGDIRAARIDALEKQFDRLQFDVEMGVQASDIFVAEQEAKDAKNLAMAALRSRP
jgi:hypothetical protein